MAEILIRVKDKINKDDFYLNLQCTKRGDVIAVCPNNHEWGSEELRSPDWRILRFPAIPEEKFHQFLSAEIDIDITQPSKTLQRRQIKFDLDTLDKIHSDFIADDSRKDSIFISNFTELDVASKQIVKPPIPDPVIVGNASNVIG